METQQASNVAKLNDAFRHSGSRVTVTSGVQFLVDVIGLVDAVKAFDTFTEDNDPYGEHDFGALDWHGSKILWKIDYYDQALRGWCDPLDPKCKRVLTILLAEEY